MKDRFKPGIGTKLTPEVHATIIKNVPRGLRPETIANLSYVLPQNLRNWLKRGMQDLMDDNCTEYYRLFVEYHAIKAEKITKWLRDIENRVKNWQASWELVKAVAREDFGIDSVEYKELLAIVEKLSEAFKRLTDKSSQGVVSDGREMDSQGNEE